MGELGQSTTEPLLDPPRVEEVAALVRTVVLTAADERRVRFGDGLTELMQAAGLNFDDAQFGELNVLRVVQSEDRMGGDEIELVERLLLRAIAHDAPGEEAETTRLVEQLMWLSANSPLNPVWRLDELGEGVAARLWLQVANRLETLDELPGGRAEALPAAVALAASFAEAAREACAARCETVNDPLLRLALSGGLARGERELAGELVPAPGTSSLDGQLQSAPLGRVALVLQGVTGILLLRYVWGFLAKVVFRCRRPVQLQVSENGIDLKSHLLVVGRTIRTRHIQIPTDNLARAVREERYPSAPLYAGLIALALGSYLGVSFLTEGSRAGSPSLMLLGIAVFGVGMVCDFLVSGLWSSRPGRVRLVFTPRRGRAFAVSTTDRGGAEAVLRRLR